MSRRVILVCAIFTTLCTTESSFAIWGRACSIQWYADLSDSVVIGSVTRLSNLDPENEVWDAQDVRCELVECLKGSCADDITFKQLYRNSRHPWKASAPAVRLGQRILIFLTKTTDRHCTVIEWINLSGPNRVANPLVRHTAYDNHCRVLVDESSILAAVRKRLKETANITDTKRRGVIMVFEPEEDMYADFVIPARPEYRQKFLDALNNDSVEKKCWAIYNLVSYPSNETVDAIRPMLRDPSAVHQAADTALRLLGRNVDQPAADFRQGLPPPFMSGFEDEHFFPQGNWKRWKDIEAEQDADGRKLAPTTTDAEARAETFAAQIKEAGGSIENIGVPGQLLALRSPPAYEVTIDANWKNDSLSILDNDLLRGVYLTVDAQVDVNGFAELCDMSQLRSMTIELGDEPPRWDLSRVRNLRDLWHLTVSGRSFTDDHLKSIGSLKQLRLLELIDTSVSNSSGRTIIAHFPALTSLVIHGGSLRSPISAFVPNGIRTLSLRGMALGDEDADFLAGLPSLRTVDLRDSRNSPNIVRRVEENPNIDLLLVDTTEERNRDTKKKTSGGRRK